MMRISIFLLAVLLLGTLLATMRGTVSEGSGNNSPSGSHRPELEYLKTVNSVAPPRDPQLLFLLMAQYANANMQGEGVEFFTARLKEFGPRLTDPQKALYLSAIGLLRAQHAPAVSLLHRVGYVKDTIAMLEQAKELSGGHIFVVNWIAGIVHSELPSFFRQRKAAQEELGWCVENIDKAPHAGWLREVYYHLGKLALADGEQAKAQDYLRRSGYADFSRPVDWHRRRYAAGLCQGRLRSTASPYAQAARTDDRLHYTLPLGPCWGSLLFPFFKSAPARLCQEQL